MSDRRNRVYREVKASYVPCDEITGKPCGYDNNGTECEGCELEYVGATDDVMDTLSAAGYQVWDIYEIELVGNERTLQVIVSRDDGQPVPKNIQDEDEVEEGGISFAAAYAIGERLAKEKAAATETKR